MISHCANNIDDFFSPAVCHLSSPFFDPWCELLVRNEHFPFSSLRQLAGHSFSIDLISFD